MRRRTGDGLVVGALMALAALSAVLLSLTVFRDLSLNNDDGVYLLQARGLLDGHLVLPSAGGDAGQPWLFAPVDGGYASKYLPFVAALYAVGLAVADATWPVTALLAAAVPWLVHRLARRCGIPPRRALVAAALVTLSPAVLVQGGLALSYLPFLVTALTCWLLAVRLAEDGRQPWAPGLAAALGFTMRPLDAVLLLAPVVVWAALRRPARWRALGLAAAGAAPVGALVAAYDARVTGSPTRLPFSLLTPDDTLGFGGRRLFPEDQLHSFGPLQSVTAMRQHFVDEPLSWFAFAAVVALLAALSLTQRRASRPSQVLALAAVPFLVGYACFWGPYAASVLWRTGPQVIGPFYALPLLPLLVLLAVQAQLPERRAVLRAGAVLALVGLGLNVLTAGRSLVQNRVNGQRNEALAEVVRAASERGPVLLDLDPPYLSHPVSLLGPLLEGRSAPLLVSSVLRPDQVLALPRATSLLLLPDDPYRRGSRFSYRLVDVELARSARPRLSVDVPGTVLVVERNGVATACTVPTGTPVELTLGATVTGCSGAALPKDWDLQPDRGCASQDCVTMQAYTADRTGTLVRKAIRRTVLARDGGAWVVPVDGPVRSEQGRGWLALHELG